MATELTLYAHSTDHLSHRVRLALAAKLIAYQLILVDNDEDKPSDLAELNPYNTLPTLVDKDVKLYFANVIIEYLDERYRQVRLLPDTPMGRAQVRQYAQQIEQDWLKPAHLLLTHPDSYQAKHAAIARQSLTDSLISLSPLFAQYPYFISETFGYLDCLIAPMLWRLKPMGIVLPPQKCSGILTYCQRVFDLPIFTRSLTVNERGFNK